MNGWIRRFSGTVLILVGVVLGGCAQLEVQVDVLNADHVRTAIAEREQRRLLLRIVQTPTGDFERQLRLSLQAFQRDLEKVAVAYEEQAKTLLAAPVDYRTPLMQIADGVRIAAAGSTLQLRMLEQSEEIETLAQEVRQAAAEFPLAPDQPLDRSLREQLTRFANLDRQQVFEQLRDLREYERSRHDIELQFDKAAAAAGAAAAPAANTHEALAASADVQKTIAAASARSIIGGLEIATTDFADIIAAADERLWKKNFNRAFAKGDLGNVDIVIRMNSAADFSVKGMRFDASTVAQIASKVLTQSLLVGAQLAGVPVATARTDSPTGGNALSGSSAELATLQQSLESRQVRADAQLNAIRSAAKLILGGRAQMEAAPFAAATTADPPRKALHDAVDAGINSLKPLLSLQDLQ